MAGKPTYGDNVFELIGAVGWCLKEAGWPRAKITGIQSEIAATKSYDDAVALCARYITIDGIPA